MTTDERASNEHLDDLLAEQSQLDDLLDELDAEQLATPTPSPGWTVADQLAHLTYFDRAAATAIEQPEDFTPMVAALFEAAVSAEDGMDRFTLDEFRDLPADRLLAEWRAGRDRLAVAAAGLEPSARVPWYGPSMSARSFLTARLMEVWAHGQDVCDALGIVRQPTDRLRHIARLGYITRDWSYINRGLEPRSEPVGLRLRAPSGAVWAFGDTDASSTIEGPAEDFCLVVSQRRHPGDTQLVLVGEAATDWMARAQVFAGPATDGPKQRRSAPEGNS